MKHLSRRQHDLPSLSLMRRLPLPAALLVACLAFGGAVHAQQTAQAALPHAITMQNPRLQPHRLSARTLAQIGELEQEKQSRLSYQQKLDSNLWYSVKMSEGLAITRSVPTLRTGIKPEADGLILVDITADVSDELLGVIKSAGGVIVNSVPQYRAIRARLPLRQMEYIAGQPGVKFIKPAVIGQTQGDPTPMFQSRGSKFLLSPYVLHGAAGGFGQRADVVRAHLPALLHKINPVFTPNTGSVDSEGDTTHRAITARNTYGVDGTGISIGVMSDSDDYLENSQASGDLPADVTVLSGQSGRPGTGEGTAMMEIVHDIAPGAKIFFAEGSGTGGSEAQMAANIVALHNAGCQVIVDDITYGDESPFQDGVIAQAVETVTAAGSYYFSSASNNGDQDSSTSGTWEDPFVDSGDTYDGSSGGKAGKIMEFDDLDGFPVEQNDVTDNSGAQKGQTISMFWSDPLGKASDDYDLYVVDANGKVLGGSTNTQNGSQDPYEQVNGVPGGDGIVVVLASGVARYLHIDCDTQHGLFGVFTDARTRGHNSVNAVGAYGVAATPATTADQQGDPTGPYPNPFNTSNVTETFSSDGPREQFFDKNGAAVSGGYILLKKPDITAADGVTTSLNQTTVGTGNESFAPFFGTSAAAPHAAALTGLLLSYNSALTQAQVRSILTGHTIDIMASGWDRDSGYGILDAVNMLAAAPIPPKPVPTHLTFSPNPVVGGQTTTATLTISTAAPAGGAAVALTVNGSSIGTDTIPAGATSNTFSVTPGAVTAVTTESWGAALNGTTITATLTVNPPPTALSTVAFSPTSVTGGSANSTGTVTLTAAAPTGGVVVSLASSNTAALTVPASVTVAAGAKTATFTATSKAVTAAATVTVTATYSGVSKTGTVTVNPAATLSSLTASPTSVVGGSANSTGTVTLTAAAPTGGTVVTLASSNTAALTVPASVTVAAGAKTATFTATSKAVTATTIAKITATLGTSSKAVNVSVTAPSATLSSLTVTPTSVAGGQANATGTVTLTANATAATTVTLTSGSTAALTVPASVTVAAGSKTATFTATSHAVTATTVAKITATLGSGTKAVNVSVTPASNTLSSLAMTPTSVAGGQANSTGTVTLTANATAATTITLTSSSTAALSVPASVTVAAGARTATFTATSHAVTATTIAKVTAALGSATKAVNVSVTPAAAGKVALSSVAASPASVVGGKANPTGTVTLTANATATTTVTLTSSNTAAVTVPSSVAVAAGQDSALFVVTSKAVTATTSVTVTATLGGVSKTCTVTVTPAATGVASLTFSPASVRGGGGNAIGTVTMAAAVATATTVTLTSSDAAALTVPSSVAVAAGQDSAIFQATSHAVTASKAVTVTATAGGVSKTAIVTVTP